MADASPPRHARPFVSMTAKTKQLHFVADEVQSSMDLRDPSALNLEYTRAMMGFLLFDAAPAQVGMIGLGGGSLAKFCYRHLPDSMIRIAEINPYVIALRDEFEVPEDDERFSIVEADGADFVRNCPASFNVLLVDGYDARGLPKALSSQRFYEDCHAALADNGLAVVNLHADARDYRQQVDRIRNAFHDAILLVEDKREGNSIVFAQQGNPLQMLSIGPLRRPASFDEKTWKSFQNAFSRILAALKDDRP
ncbi:MAG: transferase [Proteobacteria bacterium]|nr:transferase [Pseudomonadota bacterium]